MEKKFFLAEKIFFLLYFPILTAERVISIVLDIRKGAFDALEYYMVILTVLAIVFSYIYLFTHFKKIWTDENFRDISIAAGILLLGGMVHTEGTIPPLQFVAYGMLLVAMALHTVKSIKNGGKIFPKWLSFAYTLSFSMAIPVVYRAVLEYSVLFHILESAVSLVMVAVFTIMLIQFFRLDGDNNYSLFPFLIALIGDFAVVLLRLPDTLNTFVFIFYIVTIVLYLTAIFTEEKFSKK